MKHTQQEPTLTLPDVNYGAVMGKNVYTKWLIYSALCIILVVLNFFTGETSTYTNTIRVLTTTFVIIWIFFTGRTFYYKHYTFDANKRAKREEYIHGTFKTWLQNKYGIVIGNETATTLFEGYPARIDAHRTLMTMKMHHMENVWDAGKGNPVDSVREPQLMVVPPEVKKFEPIEFTPIKH